jgi:hypothetical protein
MPSIMSLLTGFGLASGAGAKAFIPVLLLGGFHYTPYFELSERWLWIASPPVMVVLGVMVLVELWVDAHPDMGRWSDLAGYLPKLVAGSIAFAAATGSVDESLTELGASGLLGAATAGSVHWLRNRIRRPIRDYVEDIHEGVGKIASLGEAGVATAVAGTAVVAPVVSLFMLAGAIGVAMAITRAIDGRRVACAHCGEPIRPAALVCPSCGREQGSA